MSRGRRRASSARDYPRSARLSQLVLEIAADTLERLDDDRLGLLTIQDVYVDNELDQAKITYIQSGQPTDDSDEFAAALDEARRAVKQAIARQARVRRTPEVIFTEDAVVETAGRVEEILRELAAEREAAGDLDAEPSAE